MNVLIFIIAMQVSLATQTLSSSVADAMLSFKALGVPGFADCYATVMFIKVSEN